MHPASATAVSIDSDDDTDIDQMDFAGVRSQYSSVLETSSLSAIQEDLFIYSARINSIAATSKIIGGIYCAVLAIQLIGPALMIAVTNIWSSNQILTKIFLVLGLLWNGSSFNNSTQRIYFSIILLIVYIVLIIVLIARARTYKLSKRMDNSEASSMITVYKNILCLLGPDMLSGIPESISYLSMKNYNVLYFIVVICCPIVFFFYLYVLYIFITPRVVLENTPTHEWTPMLQPISIFASSMLGVLSVSCGFITTAAWRCIVCLIMVAISVLCAFGIYGFVSLPKTRFCIAYGAIHFAAAALEIIQAANVIVFKLTSDLVIILAIVLLILFYVAVFLYNGRRVAKINEAIDVIYNDPEHAQELFDRYFKGPFSFACGIRLIVEEWHPYIATWELFDMAMKRWPQSTFVFLLYGRLLAMFPNQNQRMAKLGHQLAQGDVTASSVSYIYQLQRIVRFRQKKVSQKLKEAIDEFSSKRDRLQLLMRRTWENILQRSVGSFWEDIEKTNAEILELESSLLQLYGDYPNNLEVLKLYIDFEDSVKCDLKAAAELRRQYTQLQSTGRLLTDQAQLMGMTVYPNITLVMEQLETGQKQFEMDNESSDSDDVPPPESQMRASISDLISKSKLGGYCTGSIFILIFTLGIIAVFIVCDFYYSDNIITIGTDAYDYMGQAGQTYSDYMQLNLILNVLPLFQYNVIKANATTMSLIAPNLYTKGIIGIWSVNSSDLKTVSNDLSDDVRELGVYISSFSSDSTYVNDTSDAFSTTTVYNSETLQSLLVELAFDGTLLSNSSAIYSQSSFSYINSAIPNITSAFSTLLTESELYSKSSDSTGLSNFGQYMVLSVLSALVFTTLPFMLQLFRLQIQAESIAESFSMFPNVEVRKIIASLGMSSSKVEEDSRSIAGLQTTSQSGTSSVLLVLVFFSTFLPLMACNLTLYYLSQCFVSDCKSAVGVQTYLRLSSIRLREAIVYLTNIYKIDNYGGSNRSLYVSYANSTILDNIDKYGDELYGSSSALSYYYASLTDFTNYSNALSISYSAISSVYTLFERLVTNDYPDAIDLLSFGTQTFLESYATTTKIPQYSSDFLSYLMWFTNFSYQQRESVLYSIVDSHFNSLFAPYESVVTIVLVIICVWQSFSCACSILFLRSRGNQIREAMRLYFNVSPSALLQNQQAINLIESGSSKATKSLKSFENADAILSKIAQPILVTDKTLIITDFNSVFSELSKIDDPKGMKLGDIFQKGNDNSWDIFLIDLSDVFKGKMSAQFTSVVSVNTKDGRVAHLSIDVICMTTTGPAADNNPKAIESVAFLIEDNTSYVLRDQMIKQQQKQISEMLGRVLPQSIVKDLEGGAESVSFVSQCISVGSIRVGTSTKWDYSSEAPFVFFNKVFEYFDKAMEEFPDLTKARTFSHTYTYVGGLFSQINKPEKHADEAVRFALKLFGMCQEMGQQFGHSVELTIGIAVGGPVVAGVMNVRRPFFQIIGPVMELSSQMKVLGVPNTIQITRATYELVFSSGFHITERGDIALKNGEKIFTYLVAPN